MSGDLLQTKLYIPKLRPKLVSRPHLIERLNQGVQSGSKLILISAPAGFGKTTVLNEWAHNSEYPFAWVSLDESDNDPTRFLAYVVAALQEIQAQMSAAADVRGDALALLQSPQSPPIESILAALINEIAGLPGPFILVLDDYHIIQTQSVHDIVTFLLDHLPTQMHLVIASRTDPPLPLPRLRIRGELIELRLADLRFAPQETATLFNQILGLGLSAEDIAALDARTEGWIAGLQVAALSMQGLEDVSGFIRAFTGSHRYILDYLVEEVLDRQPDNIQDFLLHTAVLDSLSGPLCDAVTGQNESREILEILERANLFIVPLDDERRWYRYHHLFADLLRAILDRAMSDRVPELHHRAGTWYEQNGRLAEAVRHALAARDFEWAAHLIEKLAEVLWARGEPTTLLRWLKSLPDEHMISRPSLCIHHAWVLIMNGQNEAAEWWLHTAQEALDSETESLEQALTEKPAGQGEPAKSEERGRIAAIRASIASRQGNVAGIFQCSHQALEFLPEKSLMWRTITAMSLGFAQDLSGDLVAANRTFSDAVTMSKASGNIYLILSTGLHLGNILIQQGLLKEAYALCQELLQHAEARRVLHTQMAGCLYDELGLILCEWNELDSAMHHLSIGSDLSRQGYDVGVLGYSYLTMLRAMFAHGDIPGVQDMIQKIEKMEQDSDVPPWFTNPKEAWKARIWLVRGDLTAASSWVCDRGLSTEGDIPYLREEEYIVAARILIAQQRLPEAIELLERLLKLAEKGGRTERAIQMLMLLALANQAQQRQDEVHSAVDRVLALAEPGGHIRLFLDEGPPMAELLRETVSRRGPSDHASKLLAAFAADGRKQVASSSISSTLLIEPLSDRELTVLRLLAAGLSNREIAEELYVSINTVKAHAKNIYSKLNVNGRMQAAQRARELELLN
jgi:LuxR family maltose regulon positive regulatory protein